MITISYGAGETQFASESFPTLDAARSFLEHETDLPADELDWLFAQVLLNGEGMSREDDPTQFDRAWIRIVQTVPKVTP